MATHYRAAFSRADAGAFDLRAHGRRAAGGRGGAHGRRVYRRTAPTATRSPTFRRQRCWGEMCGRGGQPLGPA
jgi:hypothetical protein